MREFQPSKSAERVAFIRALETRKPESERICFDPFAERFLGFGLSFVLNNGVILRALGKRRARTYPGLRDYIIARTRHIDDYLAACLDDGLEQLVIAGAGYDSRAYRFQGLKDRTKVFELDHPATQYRKINKLKRIPDAAADHVTHISTDFDTEDLTDKLYANGYSKEARTLFIWEGVTYYLNEESVDATLAFVANNSVGGSSIIFDYLAPGFMTGSSDPVLSKSLLKVTEKVGEKMKYAIEPRTISQFLAERGFRDANNADGQFLKRAYFKGINQDRAPAQSFSIVSARVSG
jgi:methyltransferase (TIGR00027 family)